MKFSIITICRNSSETIAEAMQSVLSQSTDDVEYVIVDGASTDRTLDVILDQLGLPHQPVENEVCATVGGKQVRLISEPDAGLYNALNKGVCLATGDIVGFVHADDVLAHPDALKNLAAIFDEVGAEAVYGDLQYVNAAGAVVRHWQSGDYNRRKLGWGWMPPHPALYLKRTIYERAVLENGEFFDSSFRCAADYDFMMRILVGHSVVPSYSPEVLVKMKVGGVSNRSLSHIVRKSLEDWHAIRRNNVGHIHTLVWKNLGKVAQFFVR